MKITITAVGSRGDVQPYIALGRGLSRAGHEVALAVDPIFTELVSANRLIFKPLAADPMNALQTDVRELGNNPVKIFRWMAEEVSKIGLEYVESFLAANRGAELMIFSSIAAMAGVHVGAALETPMISTSLQPVVPTGAYPYATGMILSEWVPFYRAANRASYRTNNRMFYRLFYQMINRDREQTLGLPPLSWEVYANLDIGAYPMLHGFSPHVIPFPEDYGENQIFTGYWFLSPDDGYSPPKALDDFLAAGPKPVSIGFGSMVDKETEELTNMVIEAVALSGQRAVLLGGWTGMGETDLPDTILKLDAVPHDWLFPRMAAAVHHGGAGTTAASLRAGTPTVIVPFFADQPFWGWRVEKLGAGPRPVPRQKLTAEKLAAAITQAVTDQKIQTRAGRLGELIRTEDGVGKAVRSIEDIMTHKRERTMASPVLYGE